MPHPDFPCGMELDYERKFRYLDISAISDISEISEISKNWLA